MKKLLAALLVLGLCAQGYAGDIPALTNIANGDTSDAPTVMDNFNAIRDVVNGELDNDNMASDAAIVESKLNLDALAVRNFVKNADMESWAAGTSAQPNDWTAVSTPTVARDTALQGAGSYALKLTAAGAADEGSSQTLTNLKISTVYRVSALVKVTSGDTASITTTGATTNMDEDSTTASWTTVTGTFTTDGSGTDVVLQLLAQNNTDVAFFDNICVTEGTARVGFIPRHDYHTTGLTLTSNTTFVGATTINHIKFPDNLADALSLENANGDSFLKVISTTGSLSLVLTQPVGVGAAAPVNAKLYSYYDRASSFAGYFVHDGNNANRWGIRVQYGEDTGSGTNYCLRGYDGDGDEDGGLRSVAGTFAAYNTSDMRLKKNIKDTTLKGKDVVMGIKVRDYEKKKRPGKVIRAALVAQEVNQVFPEAVGDPDPETGMYAISQSLLIPPMIKHMQEMQKEIDDLKKQVKKLEAHH